MFIKKTNLLFLLVIGGIAYYLSTPLPIWLDLIFLSICAFDLFIIFAVASIAKFDRLIMEDVKNWDRNNVVHYTIFATAFSIFNLVISNPIAQSLTWGTFIISLVNFW